MLKIVKNKLYCLYYIVIVYLYAAWYILLQWLQKHNKPSRLNYFNKRRVALITGGATGIGFETSRHLLKLNFIIIIAGIYNNQKKGLEELRLSYGEKKVLFLECDLASLKSVHQLVLEFEKLKLPLHVLINNAGIMFSPFIETKDGHEGHWGINYLSHFYLTHLLLKHLIKSGTLMCPSRVVNLGSCLHYLGTINFEDVDSKKFYSAEAAYCQSKLGMVMFAKKMSKILEEKSVPILINAVHPAVAFSKLYRHVWWASKIPSIAKFFFNTPADASDTVVHAAFSDEVVNGGNYFENCRIVEASREARSLIAQDKLWKLSMFQLAITEFGNN